MDEAKKPIYQSSQRPVLFPLPIIIGTVHLLALIGIIFFPPTKSALIMTGLIICLFMIGITLCYHRCLTHRAFDFKFKWMERFFASLGALSLQRGPIWWCSIHRLHHKNSDTDQDPHNSRRGFWFSHVLWLAYLDPRWVFHHRLEGFRNHVRDIAKDPYYRLLDKYFALPGFGLWILYYVLGGWTWFFWVGPIAVVIAWHITWLVNSATHLWGYSSYDTGDYSTNNPVVGLLAFGEGWHNNHHAFPSSPKNGFFKWWEFDLTYLIILALKGMGLVHNLKKPEKHTINIRAVSVKA